MEQIKGGYVMIARKIDSSSIAESPPYAREIWLYLIRSANHKNNSICKRGQTVRRYIDIREALKWYVGYRKCMYSVTQCENAMKLLVKAKMITKTRTTRGLLITICNYDIYQNPKSYESQFHAPTASATMKPQPCQTINKNVKNVKNKETTANDKYIDYFEIPRGIYPGTKRGNETEFDNFKQKHSDWKKVLPLLELAILKQIRWRKNTDGEFRPP